MESRAAKEETWVVVPAFNEGSAVRATVMELRRCFARIVVVDDGSSDATTEEALAAGAIVLRQPLNLGQGAALQTGIEFSVARGARFIATFDADGQHHVEDLERMLERLLAGGADVVIGSRFLGRAEGLSHARRWALRAAVAFTNVTSGVRMTDAHNGLRLMTSAAARRLKIRQDGMAHASELISQMVALGLRIEEVPVTISYTAYSTAKGQRLSNSFRIVTDLVAGWLLK